MIVANHTEMTALAARVAQAAEVAAQEVDSTHSQLAGLAEAFQGRTATAFEERHGEWSASARELVDALRELGGWLQHAADAMAEHDQAGASSLRA